MAAPIDNTTAPEDSFTAATIDYQTALFAPPGSTIALGAPNPLVSATGRREQEKGGQSEGHELPHPP